MGRSPCGTGASSRMALLLPAAITTITGRAWLTGTTQFFLDPEDPFPEGFYL